MLRCRTKTIEENLADTSIVRCHRSYMINVTKINHIKKSSQGRYIILNNTDIKPIPVSKSYFKNLVEKIDKYNSTLLSHHSADSNATTSTATPTEENEPSQEA